MEVSLVRFEEQLDNQKERVVQAANVSQPIEDAVCLSSCGFYAIYWHKVDVCKGVCSIRIRDKIIGIAIISWQRRSNAEEVFLILLSILNQVGLIFDRAHLDFNVLPLSFFSIASE